MVEAPIGYQCPNCAGQARSGGRRASIVVRRGGTVTAARALLVANIAMFVVEAAIGANAFQGPGIRTLFDLGALQPIAIAQGHQYWRLFTAMFLHAGLLHLVLNMYGLYLFGFLIEDTFGTPAFLGIYFVSGFLASVATYAFGSPNAIAVGASGAIFGLLGAWVAYNYRRRGTAMGSANLRTAALIVGLNLVLGFSIAGIDNLAHIGGLVTGVITGFAAEGLSYKRISRAVAIGVFLALVVAGVALTVWRTSELTRGIPFGL
jgi:rhomboid protease GluP